MGQIDFGNIISAAAVSTLGVLSLIVVLLGVLAFYFFKGSPEKTKLTVWLTLLIAGGLFALGFIKQADRATPAGPGPQASGTPPAVDPVEPVDPETSVPAGTETPRATGTPRAAEAAKTTGTAGGTISAKAFDPSDLTGQWHSNDGYVYDVNATSTVFAYEVYLNGQNVGAGQGSRDGNNLNYGYWSKGGGGTQGTCRAIVAADQRSMSGTCTSGMQSWPMFAER